VPVWRGDVSFSAATAVAYATPAHLAAAAIAVDAAGGY